VKPLSEYLRSRNVQLARDLETPFPIQNISNRAVDFSCGENTIAVIGAKPAVTTLSERRVCA